jgi:hypothetical protein
VCVRFKDSESRSAVFLARILLKMRLASRENIIAIFASLTSLARRQKCFIVKLASLAILKLELILTTKFLFPRLIRSKSRHEICLQDSREASLTANFCLRDSLEASLAINFNSRVSLLILIRESRKNLARILGLKSESRFSREFQKVILVSTLVQISRDRKVPAALVTTGPAGSAHGFVNTSHNGGG